jgi:hypothetical protein
MTRNQALRPILLLAGILIASLIAIQFILFSGQKAMKIYKKKKKEHISLYLPHPSPAISFTL